MIKTLLQKKVSSMALVGGILSLLGAIFILSAVIMVGITLISLAGTVSTQGAIISCAGYNDGCQPVVRFHTPSDRVITFRSSSSSSSYTPEKTVTVWYHLDNPQNAQLDPWPIITILSLAFGGIGFILLLVGLFLFLRAGNHPSAKVVHHYYTALENQDYAAAFQDLNPNIQTPDREPFTLAWFIQQEQMSKKTQGTITTHAITNFNMTSASISLRISYASFTVKVTRGESTYKTYPYVVREGDQWKILRFDGSQQRLN